MTAGKTHTKSVFVSVQEPRTVFQTDYIVTRLKGAEHCEQMMSLSSPRRAIVTRDLAKPSLVELVANFVCVCPLIVSYIKGTGKKTDGDS